MLNTNLVRCYSKDWITELTLMARVIGSAAGERKCEGAGVSARAGTCKCEHTRTCSGRVSQGPHCSREVAVSQTSVQDWAAAQATEPG